MSKEILGTCSYQLHTVPHPKRLSCLDWVPANRVRAALQKLYDENAEYIRINNLGNIHHNQAMKDARDALNEPEDERPFSPQVFYGRWLRNNSKYRESDRLTIGGAMMFAKDYADYVKQFSSNPPLPACVLYLMGLSDEEWESLKEFAPLELRLRIAKLYGHLSASHQEQDSSEKNSQSPSPDQLLKLFSKQPWAKRLEASVAANSKGFIFMVLAEVYYMGMEPAASTTLTIEQLKEQMSAALQLHDEEGLPPSDDIVMICAQVAYAHLKGTK